jgi:hypothetical protein
MRAHETPQRLQTAGVGADPRGAEVGVDLRKLPLVGEARRPADKTLLQTLHDQLPVHSWRR